MYSDYVLSNHSYLGLRVNCLMKWLVVIDFALFSDVFEADLAKNNKQKQRSVMQGTSRSQKVVHKAKRRRLSSSSSG